MNASFPGTVRIRILCLFLFIFCSAVSLKAQEGRYKTLADGVIIFPKEEQSGNTRAVRLQVFSDKIIRVTASPQAEIPLRESLIVTAKPSGVPVTVQEKDNHITLSTGVLVASVSLATGTVSFADSKGNPILSERAQKGRVMEPSYFEGQPLYSIRQNFVSDADDAWYGLGQHQEDAWNYRGKQVVFFQNNTEVAVPFLLSRKNYGLLWDNYSYSRAGDTRSFLPLSSFRLFDKNGNPGWLTASYINDRNKPGEIAFEMAESDIEYAYVGESRLHLPSAFHIEKGQITWQGSIASEASGTHKLKFAYAGYIKVYVDGKAVADKWRQAWNPGTALVEHTMAAGKKYALRIEWIPDGSESYLTAQMLPPVPAEDANGFGFYSEAGRAVDYYFVMGNNPDEVISGYRQLTGKAPIVPKWAFGFWQSRERYKTQDEILATVSEFRKRNIPLDNIVLDWSYWKEDDWGSQEFDHSRFSNPDSMIKVLHDRYKVQLMISVWPKFYEGIDAYKMFDANGWLYKRNIADRQRDWIGKGYVSTFYDAFNADARKGFWKLIHDKLYVRGIDAWWMDASEPDILSNVSPARRKAQMSPTALGSAAEFLNAYPLQNAKGIYEGQRGVDSNKRVFLLTRSGFAGSQRYAAAIWSGDIASRWEDMKAQISAGLNFSMSGLPYWTMDIGGFSVEGRFYQPNAADLDEWREMQTRWYQYGAFVPLFRVHGQFPFREIYHTAPEGHPAYSSMLYYNQLRYRLMPYIYSLAGQAYHHDYTIMRGLVMDFPGDRNTWHIGDQFMFGPALLVNPVYRYQARERNLYLPAGQGWYDAYSGRYFAGGSNLAAPAPYDRIPLFVKEGSIIPTGPALQYVAEKPAEPITLFVYTGQNAGFTLYEDENLNYNYEKGAYSEISFTWDDAQRTLSIGDRKGSFKGMVTNRTFQVIVVDRSHPSGLNFEKKPDKTVRYSGKKLNLRF